MAYDMALNLLPFPPKTSNGAKNVENSDNSLPYPQDLSLTAAF